MYLKRSIHFQCKWIYDQFLLLSDLPLQVWFFPWNFALQYCHQMQPILPLLLNHRRLGSNPANASPGFAKTNIKIYPFESWADLHKLFLSVCLGNLEKKYTLFLICKYLKFSKYKKKVTSVQVSPHFWRVDS